MIRREYKAFGYCFGLGGGSIAHPTKVSSVDRQNVLEKLRRFVVPFSRSSKCPLFVLKGKVVSILQFSQGLSDKALHVQNHSQQFQRKRPIQKSPQSRLHVQQSVGVGFKRVPTVVPFYISHRLPNGTSGVSQESRGGPYEFDRIVMPAGSFCSHLQPILMVRYQERAGKCPDGAKCLNPGGPLTAVGRGKSDQRCQQQSSGEATGYEPHFLFPHFLPNFLGGIVA
ncbi:hypothetical protein SAMN05216321_101147 [Cupriavidus sp. OV038]|jgi:hypothetical protein|uniref:hypothetical protein n=1 Tax=unclassified Cupriavidus TaxID=2640874 RepID=UPI0008EA24A7|nr:MULTISPECIES: hypothetical protein [unclassified Cupriavidus]SFB68994.1 hypothetical protein SAMN05216321_101147 [Cupriavidus sp. OV038]SFO58401.1 hypothetical protein SAMN05216322_101147 [Cupriavidus sp. OV096]